MNYKEAISYCLSLPGTNKTLEATEKHRIVLSVNDQIYGLFETGAPIQWKFTLQVAPEEVEELVEPPLIRSADMDDEGHWVTIERLENFDGDRLKSLITWSHQQASNVVQNDSV